MGKDHLRVEACGSVDELCAFLGMGKSLIAGKGRKELVDAIQRDLFLIGAEVVTQTKSLNVLKERIGTAHVRRLEKHIEGLERRGVAREGSFYLPGEDFVSSTIDVARVLARRVERMFVRLAKRGVVKNRRIVVYLNRLSDLLFLLAREIEPRHRSFKRRR